MPGSSTRTAYSPSSGKVWRTARPPLVPKGRSSLMRSPCRTVCAMRYVSVVGGRVGSPTAARAIRTAAARYRSSSDGVMVSPRLLSNPKLDASGGSRLGPSTSTPRRSRTALTYCSRLSRWKVGGPGSGAAAAARSSALSTADAKRSSTVRSGRGAGTFGIAPMRIFHAIFSHSSGSSAIRSTSACSSVRPPVSSRSLWQRTQYRARSSGSGVSAAV